MTDGERNFLLAVATKASTDSPTRISAERLIAEEVERITRGSSVKDEGEDSRMEKLVEQWHQRWQTKRVDITELANIGTPIGCLFSTSLAFTLLLGRRVDRKVGGFYIRQFSPRELYLEPA